MPPPLRPRRLLGDEELGKRDDDHKPGAGRSPLGNVWTVRRVHSLAGKRNMKRIGIGLVVIVLLYYFFKNMPTDIEPQRRPHFPPAEYARQPSKSSGATPEEYETSEERQHYFSGPIKFYQLATSLNKIINVRGPAVNNNVLFAASSLKSAAILIPIACEMAQFERNKVHFALMSRDEIPMDILRSVNGYSQDCSVMFHGVFGSLVCWYSLKKLMMFLRCTTRFFDHQHRFSNGGQLFSRFRPYQHLYAPKCNHSGCIWRGGGLLSKGFPRESQFTGDCFDRTAR